MKKLLGMAAAAAAGYVAGVLFAPKSGEETRKDLKAKKDELVDKAAVKKEQAKEVYEESSETVKKGAADISDEASDFSKKASTSASRIGKEAKSIGTQAKRSLGRAADTATKTGKDVGESVNKLR
ncbi:hypothetical protein GII36_05410 [Candidatus Mycosynbacter amalyticus]|uniref:YtxH domain-containing protein n=1 Tax=Candidatus Mycosynbacter amalyticus TaxID=2665156 RepID=A0A857MN23_9BACT|nr:YtxH domain-containing protein [Candidatus Mycosynbacter amalyticus]QHN43255.1 hypothetical protein GII36_05410 [Candidatus Mycosynbacter amalyticus]